MLQIHESLTSTTLPPGWSQSQHWYTVDHRWNVHGSHIPRQGFQLYEIGSDRVIASTSTLAEAIAEAEKLIAAEATYAENGYDPIAMGA